MATNGHRYLELDSLRGVAAATVVFHHFFYVFRDTPAYPAIQHSPLRIFIAGNEAVILFFLLSGFVLSIPFNKQSSQNYREFLVKRFCRIYLPYIAAVGLAAVGDFFLHSTVPSGNSWIDGTWSRTPTLRLLLQHALMLRKFDFAQLNTAFWSLVYEARISIIFPALWWIGNRVRSAILLPASFAFTMALAFLSRRLHMPDTCITLLYASFFLVGILLCKNLDRISAWVQRQSTLSRIAVGVTALACFYLPGAMELPLHPLPVPITVQTYLRNWLQLVGAAYFLISAITSTQFRHILHHPALVHLGKISYSLYLVHGTILFTLIRIFYGRVNFAWLAPVYLLGTYLATEAFYFGVEQRSMQIGRRLATRFKDTGSKPSASPTTV